MNKNKKITYIVVAILALGLSFYSGVRYAQGNTTATPNRGAGFASGRTTRAGGGQFGGGAGGGVTAGSIISSDSNSVTISLRAGGSQIVFFSPATAILTTASGTPADFIDGKQVVVQGTSNSDSSINATSIQVR